MKPLLVLLVLLVGCSEEVPFYNCTNDDEGRTMFDHYTTSDGAMYVCYRSDLQEPPTTEQILRYGEKLEDLTEYFTEETYWEQTKGFTYTAEISENDLLLWSCFPTERCTEAALEAEHVCCYGEAKP